MSSKSNENVKKMNSYHAAVESRPDDDVSDGQGVPNKKRRVLQLWVQFLEVKEEQGGESEALN